MNPNKYSGGLEGIPRPTRDNIVNGPVAGLTSNRTPMLPMSLDDIDLACKELNELVDSIVARLRPVTSPFPDAPPSPMGELPPVPEAIHRLRNTQASLQYAISTLRALRANLEV